MKKVFVFAGLTLLFISCNRDFLEKPPGVEITEDVIFSNMAQTETFVAATYQASVPNGYPLSGALERRLNGGILAAACDEGDMANTWTNAQGWNKGSIPNNNIIWDEDERVTSRWQAVRKCNILLERVDGVPGATDEFKKQVRGEALFMRALLYFETVKRYGGVPIVSKRLQPDDEILIPRSQLDSCIDFIIKDCDDAVNLLPPSQPAAMRGRATKGAALALKARTLLYAASPLFNTATPYIDFGNNNKLICYGNYDKNRWKQAADAAKATIDWASGSGCTLVKQYGIDQNYETMWTQPDNEEIILASKAYGAWGRATRPMQVILPSWAGTSWQDGGVSVPFNFVKFYEKKDGTPQQWNMNGGNDLIAKYNELDPRFKQTIAAHGDTWNSSVGKISLITAPMNTYCRGGHWMRKTIPRQLSRTGSDTYVINWIVFRLGEVYLNYAEALNEFNDAPPEEAYAAVDEVRKRADMPALPRGLTKEQFRQRVRNERAVELAFEEHRFWDIRRWLIANEEGVMKGAFYGLTITAVAGNANEAAYKPVVFENRVWNDRQYLHPFPSGEIFKGYLVQNPGW
jgi:starch-binding outer membrane protein, SusD/RagB family